MKSFDTNELFEALKKYCGFEHDSRKTLMLTKLPGKPAAGLTAYLAPAQQCIRVHSCSP